MCVHYSDGIEKTELGYKSKLTAITGNYKCGKHVSAFCNGHQVMTVVGKDGSPVVTTEVTGVTTKRILDRNETNTSLVTTTQPSQIIIDDEDEFVEREDWESVRTLVHVLYDVNISMAIIQSLIGLLLFLTIWDRNLREKSPMWYLYHLTAVSVFTGLVLHSTTHAGLVYENQDFCYFVMYSAEYAFFGTSMNILLINAEIYFTKILTLPRWQSNQFFRFIVSMLTGWLIVSLLIAYVIINNNDGRNSGGAFCFYLKSEAVRTLRVVLRTLIPAIICLLYIIVLIVTSVLKRSRISFVSMSGQLKEVRTEGSENEAQWLMCAVFLNTVLIIRAVCMVIVHFNSRISGPDHYRWLIFMILIHVQSMYTLPMCLFFLSDVRTALKKIVLIALQKLSQGRLRFSDDMETLSVSFSNINSPE